MRNRFVVEDDIRSALGEAEAADSTSRERHVLWKQATGVSPRSPEFLLPRVVREVRREWPPLMVNPRDELRRTREELEYEVRQLAPWSVPIPLAHGVKTMFEDDRLAMVVGSRLKFRRQLILGTVADLLGDEFPTTSVLDIGCNCGFFSIDAACRGARQVDGVDLRARNVAQARFVAQHYGIENVNFSARDVASFHSGHQWDVVLNLGVLYHVTEPVQLLRQTYELCRRLAIIDTNCHLEPVSAYMVIADKDVDSMTEGREPLEFLPTYRAAIDTLRYVGFSDVFEIIGAGEKPHKAYAAGQRRCFLAIK